MPKCGNDECCSSTGIHEGITFGFGELDMYGYWEHPCRICAKDYDETLEERVQELALTEWNVNWVYTFAKVNNFIIDEYYYY